jgi:prevent-host-death family protein
MDQTIGITEARSRLGELVDQVRYRGDTVVLVKSGKPAAALVPFEMLEMWRRARAAAFVVVDEVRKQNLDTAMGNEELLDWVNDVVHEMRRNPQAPSA